MQERIIPQYVQELLAEIEQNATADTGRMEKLCDKLDQFANENNDSVLRGQSLFYRGFNKYANSQLNEGMEILSLSINHLISAELWRLAANAYNSMANIADFQGDVSMAIEYYLKGLYIATEHKIAKLEYTIRCGISNIYIGLGSYENALTMLLECEHIQESGETVPVNPMLVATANMVSCYIHLGDADKAAQKLDTLRRMYRDYPASLNTLLLCILESQFYHLSGNTDALDAAIATLDKLELSDIDVFDASNELVLHAQLLLDLEKIEELNLLLNRLEELVDNPTVEQKLLDLRMMYYYKIGDHARLAEQALKFHKVSRECEQERNKIVNHNIVTRMRLDDETRKRQEAERSNLVLKQKSEHDALTGLSNRHKFNETAELAFQKAQHSGTPLAIEILDIDFYKEYNDHYGHQAGDECLVRIADALRSMEAFEGIHTARYGGDEFVIIYENRNKDEVEEMAQNLKDKIHSLNIRHDFSPISDRITISQGVFHSVPSDSNNPLDFLSGADLSLYGVKRRGKNGYHIATDFQSVRQYNMGEST